MEHERGTVDRLKSMDRALVRQFLAVFLPLAALVTIGALVVGHTRMAQEFGRLQEGESARTLLGMEQVSRALQKVPAHIRSLQREKFIRAAIDNPSPQTLGPMADALTTLLQRNPEYDQARWIDEHGMERVRVNRAKDGAGVVVVPDSNLQDKSDRAYFRESVGLSPEQVYISRLDLNVENGKIVLPFQPTLRFTIPVIDSGGTRRGILAINYRAKPLIEDFIDTTGRTDRHTTLVDWQGYWLSSPEPADEWAFMFDRPVTMEREFPAAWGYITREPAGQVHADDGLWTWRSIALDGQTERLGNVRGPTWAVISHISAEKVRQLKFDVWSPVWTAALLIVAIFAVLSHIIAVRSRRERIAREEQLASQTKAAEERARFAVLEQAQAASARLAAIVDSSQDAIISKGLDSVITSWNNGAEHLFGYSAAEAIGRSIAMLIPPERQHEEREIIRRIANGEVVKHFETVRLHKDGHAIDISATISPVRDFSGIVIGASKIARDITEAKRTAEELERHRQRLEHLVAERTAQITESAEKLRERDKLITAVIDNIPGVVSYWGRDLRCRFANRGFIEWFGKTPEQMLGQSIEESLGYSIVDVGASPGEGLLRGTPHYAEHSFVKPDGEQGCLSVYYLPDVKDGTVIGFFVLAIDVTKQKHAEDRLRQLNSKLTDALASAQEANRAKSQFLANMSHEIRTPMNGVIGMLEILGHTTLDNDQARMIGTINSSAQSLLQIINDILDFSKIEAGQLKVELVHVDAAQIVESTARLFLGAAIAKSISIRCFTAPALRNSLLTDPVRLRQILSNLVSNAIKFTATGGVTITADLVESGSGEESLRFVVRDTGIGISTEAQARLFQPFTQADGSTARQFGGTGLGLSISRRLATLMGGDIDLVSREGQGTEAILTLPARWLPAPPQTADVDLHGVRAGLLIGDDVEYGYIAAYLAYWGAEIVRLSRDPEAILAWASGATPIIVAPASDMAAVRAATEQVRAQHQGDPLRFVYYGHDDLAVDQQPAGDSILTTSLSRARIVTAVAIAAGRMSPEIEMDHSLQKSVAPAAVLTRDEAIAAGKLILLAEDHPVNREVILRQLRLLGYCADAVEDGAQALVALGRTSYGLLLTDCNMPVMDGFTLVGNIRRASKPGEHLPVIALTANALEGEDRRCIAAGMDDYLSKPVDLDTLRRHLERWLAQAKPGRVADLGAQPDSAAISPRDAVFDLSLLAEYCEDDPAAIRQMLRKYLDSIRSDLDRLSDAAASRDFENAELYSHRMKGAARAVGNAQLAAHNEVVEGAARARDLSTINTWIPRIEEAVIAADRMFDEMSASENPPLPRSAAG